MKITKDRIEWAVKHGEKGLLICPTCDEVLTTDIMGKKCTSCREWTYHSVCWKRFYELIEGAELKIPKSSNKNPNSFELKHCSEKYVKEKIKSCEGKHVQQVCYSTYHDAFTQICFGCKKIRTNLEQEK